MTTWGIVATIRADHTTILNFAAHHLELGAHRLYLYLDEPNPTAEAALKAHPKVRLRVCDAGYWKRQNGSRPAKHQVRQTLNATHAYARPAEVDWLAHIDVDEFLWPETGVAEALTALPAQAFTARVRPAEALAPDTPDFYAPATAFKAMHIDRTARDRSTARLYPDYAAHIDDGFLSHVAGKIFLRTGMGDIEFRIHNARKGELQNPGAVDLTTVSLLHCHANDWEDFRSRFDYRHSHGAYRAELGRKGPSGLTLHEVFAALLDSEGEDGLRRFHDSLCTATPSHCAALQAEGLLRIHDLQLEQKRARQFPQH
ncbi:glycosyltransferase family 2 protein [Arenibacterium halophilum]|uniref:Glycosyltransferase family 2 protein n=1 Tax=Arenibacterium halophilum TaxID=2583821 RepID=A0ABY2XDQ9_9RHOB|nr:glycosyltransferase family 2 protein [Arenibacterium halophilum]TMV14793.1 glycosyltransferase family 2 protein [Arenibacterium halophilum]